VDVVQIIDCIMDDKQTQEGMHESKSAAAPYRQLIIDRFFNGFLLIKGCVPSCKSTIAPLDAKWS
jgi:hypothetical protein